MSDLGRAQKTLSVTASLHWAKRAEHGSTLLKLLGVLVTALNEVRADGKIAAFQTAIDGLVEQARLAAGELDHGARLMAEAADDCTFGEAGSALAQLDQMIVRTYPEAGQQGSLHEEDAILGRLLPETVGSYVDVGAWRPIEQSNTWRLYQRGWRGLLVEPVPAAWAALLHQRPGDLLSPLAVAEDAGFARLWAAGPCSTIRPDVEPEEASLVVAARQRMDVILNNYPTVRDGALLMSVDVEGAEYGVLASTDWSVFRPKVLVIEYKSPKDGSDQSGEWRGIVEAAGYTEVERTENNLIFQIG